MLDQVHPLEPSPEDFLLPENSDQAEAVQGLGLDQVYGLYEQVLGTVFN
jgi:hypothetical protein